MGGQTPHTKQICLLHVHTFVSEESMALSRVKYRPSMHVPTVLGEHMAMALELLQLVRTNAPLEKWVFW